MLEILFAVFFVAMALYCVLAPDRAFRSQRLRLVAATCFSVAAVASVIALAVE